MNTKRNYKLLLSVAVACLLVLMTACGSNGGSNNGQGSAASNPPESAAPEVEEKERMLVVTSFYPLYYMAKEIGGDHIEAVNLIPAGVDPHDWTPRSGDLSTASKAKLLLYHGVGLESWMEGFLKGLPADSTLLAREMSHGITLISGDEAEEKHDDHGDDEHGHDGHDHDDEHKDEHADEHADETGHEHSHDTDPHTWSSPKSLLIIAENVKNALIEVDAEHTQQYEESYAELHAKLKAMDERYTQALTAATNKNIVVSHQAFGYLARDYGLTQVSIMGLSADAEPRAQDLLKIAKFVKENNVKYIFFEELISDTLAKTLASEAKVDTMVLNPLEGLTPAQQKSGEDLLSLLDVNLQNLIEALQ